MLRFVFKILFIQLYTYRLLLRQYNCLDMPSFFGLNLSCISILLKNITIGISNNGIVICFSLEHGKDYHLYIPVIDNDCDQTQCFISSYIEAGGLSPFVKDLTDANFLSMDEKVNIKNPH